jgi:hypothetical protein
VGHCRRVPRSRDPRPPVSSPLTGFRTDQTRLSSLKRLCYAPIPVSFIRFSAWQGWGAWRSLAMSVSTRRPPGSAEDGVDEFSLFEIFFFFRTAFTE